MLAKRFGPLLGPAYKGPRFASFDSLRRSLAEAEGDFESWFEGSVVTKEGRPRKVFHGTQEGEFDEFEVPAYFSSSVGEAAMYSLEDSTYHEWIAKGRRVVEEEFPPHQTVDELEDGITYSEDSSWWEPNKWYNVGDAVFRKIPDDSKSRGYRLEMLKGLRVDFNWNTGRYERIEVGNPRDRRILEAYLRIRNPIELPWNKANDLAGKGNSRGTGSSDQARSLMAQGYDGVVTESDFSLALNYIIFDPANVWFLSWKHPHDYL